MDEKKEIRNTAYQVSTQEEGRTVEGYALLFGVSSDGLPFEEEIQRGALDGVLEKSDVFALLDHNQSRGVLARSKKGQGSLLLTVDNKGLRYRFEAPNTALGEELLENIRRGEIDQSSFCFLVESEKWEKKDDGTWKRSIEKISELFDISPVYNAAYSKTSVYTRGKDDAEKELQEQEERHLNNYYNNIEKSLNL